MSHESCLTPKTKTAASVLLSLAIALGATSAWADPGGGGGGLGGGGASGPEPSQWSFMLISAVMLAGVALYRSRAQAKQKL